MVENATTIKELMLNNRDASSLINAQIQRKIPVKRYHYAKLLNKKQQFKKKKKNQFYAHSMKCKT